MIMVDKSQPEEDDLAAMLNGHITDHVNGTTTLRLQYPIGTEGNEHTELKVARPRAKHMRSFDSKKPELDQLLKMAEDLTGLSQNQIDALDAADAMRLVAVIGRDFAAGLGGNSGGS